MADIDQIIAGGAKTNANFDFNSLINVPARQAAEEAYKQEGRDLFKGGVPLNKDGTIDYGAMRDALFKHGDVGQGTALDNLDLQRQKLKFGLAQSEEMRRYQLGLPPSDQSGQSSSQSPPPMLPPSANRSASTPVAPALNQGTGPQAQGAAPAPSGTAPTGARASVMQVLAAQGIPNDQLENASASVGRQLGVDPKQQLDLNDPQVRNVLAPAVAQLKRMGVGNIIPPGQPAPDQPLQPPGAVPVPQSRPPGAPGPQPMAQAAPPQAVPQPPPQAPQGQTSPVTSAMTGTTAPATPSRAERAIAFYQSVLTNPNSAAENIKGAQLQLDHLLKNAELTPELKNYAHAVSQGFTGTAQDLATKIEADKTYAAENTKSYIKKYDAIQTAGDRARTDLPKLDLAVRLTKDPNFYSGVGENYNLILKRAITALGGDENTAAPQEAFRKVVSDTILDQIKAMAGTGPVRVAEMKIIEAAAANPGNTPQANRLVLELASRMQKRAATLADMAQNYNNGRLDSGFERKVAAYDRANPLISDNEIPDFRKIIGGAGAKATPDAQPKFSSPSDVHAAISAGKLKSGDAFTDGTGKTRYVP